MCHGIHEVCPSEVLLLLGELHHRRSRLAALWLPFPSPLVTEAPGEPRVTEWTPWQSAPLGRAPWKIPGYPLLGQCRATHHHQGRVSCRLTSILPAGWSVPPVVPQT